MGTALSAKDGKVKVTVSTPKIGPLPALDDEVIDIRIASSPGVLAVAISNPAIPQLPVGGASSDWSLVQNLGSGSTYYFNSKTGATQQRPARSCLRDLRRGRVDVAGGSPSSLGAVNCRYANPIAPSAKPKKATPKAAPPAKAAAVATAATAGRGARINAELASTPR